MFPKRVGDYFDCRRGIATGANDYFCLSRAEMREHRLAETHVAPCITKAADADGLVFTREKFDALVLATAGAYLLNPSRNGQDLRRYLELGEQRGIPQRHLPSHRPVWYLPENRAVADIWVAVFSRESVKFILNQSGAKNLTCFHGLYAKPGCEALRTIDDAVPEQLGRTAGLLTGESVLRRWAEQARTEGRGRHALPGDAESESSRGGRAYPGVDRVGEAAAG